MSRVSFRAVDAGLEVEHGALICWVAGKDDAGIVHELMLQNWAEDEQPEGEDDGVYLEYNDQAYGGYNLVRSCRLETDRLCVDLAKPLDRLKDVDGFDVRLDVDDMDYEQLRSGLRRIFRDEPHLLESSRAPS